MGDAVLSEVRGRVLVITLNRPEARNAVNGDLATGLEAAVDRLEEDEALWVGVLTHNGPVFCAGADLKLVASGRVTEMITARGDFGGYVRRERTKPVIAALAGDALAGGCELAIASDLIVAARGVRIGVPEVKRSLLAMAGGVANLPRLLGEKVAMEMLLTGDPLPAERLHDLGLVNAVVEEGAVFEAALALADRIAANAPLAVRASRAAVVEGRDMGAEDRWRLVLDKMMPLYATEDFREGPRAFVEKRAPEWKAR
ncbi:MAG: enoyl-CoA hydratase/isomerase family protein [Acidimicrobiia bacterium]|nr:enoyl-CoA hydratase/isomerase family protein [Acidimicrobiia bacterium]